MRAYMIKTKTRIKHFLGMKDLEKEEIEYLIERSLHWAGRENEFTSTLKDTFVTNLFFEPSTRTRISFEVAAKRLGANILTFTPESSSLTKGESVYDTVKTLEAMGTKIAIIRHTDNNLLKQLVPHMNIPIVNAGMGTEEHPSQTLLDLVTIKQHFGTFDNLHVLIVGDIVHSRVAHSGMIAMQKLGMKVSVSGPEQYIDETLPTGVNFIPLDQGVEQADVVMLLRVQLERHKTEMQWTSEQYLNQFGLTTERHRRMKPNAVIMHPAPVNRGVEIESHLVEAHNSLIFKQVTNGVAARMAILEWIIQ